MNNTVEFVSARPTPTTYDEEILLAMFRTPMGTLSTLPISATISWDVDAVSRNTNDSLSGLDLYSFGIVNDKTIYTNVTSNEITGYTPDPLFQASYFDDYNTMVFDFISGGTLTLSVSDDELGNLTSTQNASGWIDYNTGYYSISNGLGIDAISASDIVADYLAYNGPYTVGTLVNAATASGLSSVANDISYMYEFTSDISTVTIVNTAVAYFPAYPFNPEIVITNFNNLPETRELTFEWQNKYLGTQVGSPPYGKYYWDYDVPAGGVVSHDEQNAIQIYREYLLNAGVFNSSTRQAYLSSFTFYASAFDSRTQTFSSGTGISAASIEITPQTFILSAVNVVQIDEFPDDSSFRFRSTVSNNDPFSVDNKLWRTVAMSTVSATPLIQIPGWDETQGTVGVDWGDDTTTTSLPTLTSVVAHTYSVPPLSTFRIATFATAASAENWLSAHSKSDTKGFMDIQFVDRFLSGNFIAYPEYYFDLSGNYHILTTANYTESMGVCAYGEGSNVTINLSAAEAELGKNTLYQWGIDYAPSLSSTNTYTAIISVDDGTREDTYDFGEEYSYTEAGSALSLTVFNDDFVSGMNPWYNNDDNERVKYPNFDSYTYAHTISSDNSDVLFQNVRVVEYEDLEYELSPLTQTLVDGEIEVSTTLSVSTPSSSPIVVTDQTFLWELFSAGWSAPITEESSSRDFTYTLVEGNGIIPGTILVGDTITLSASISGYTDKDIIVRDFDTKQDIINLPAVTASVIGEFEPNLRIFSNDLHSLTGETIYFQNITNTATSGVESSAFIWDVGDGSANVVVSGTDTSLISASYAEAGTYGVSLTSILNDGNITTKEFASIIQVNNDYPPYDEDVVRVYGTGGIEFPHEFLTIEMKPNEWVTADNINSSFKKIDEDLDYIKDAARKYLEPPSKYYGWLGQSTYSETDISWHVTIPGINSQFSSTENIVDNSRGLNDIRDLSIYNDNIYTVTDTAVYILSSDFNATEISTRTTKTIGDPFFNITSLEINSQGQIYVLDAAVHKIVVFDNYETNGWKFLYSWGKYGGANTFKGFITPTDLHIDSADNVWVTDSGSNVVKKYTKSGSWLMTIKDSLLTGVVSTTTDDNGHIHILTNTSIRKYTATGVFIEEYMIGPSDQTPKKIINGRDGFLYASYSGSVIKLTTSGKYAGNFGDTFDDVSYGKIFHDVNRNLYVTNTNSFLKYYERVTIESIITDTGITDWDLSDIYIDKNEYVQDWVYNKSISRIWDNIEIVRRSMIGAIYETTDRQGKLKNQIVGFTPAQYNLLFSSKPKEEIFIGINEIVTADSINRCLGSLFVVLDLLLQIVSGELNSSDGLGGDTGLDDLDLDDGGNLAGIGWRWTDVASWGMNPFTWDQVSTRGFYPTEWECAITDKICD